MNKPEAVVFDVDGTLCDVRPIRHYVKGEHKNFDAFHRASAFCDPNQQVVDELRKQQELGRVIIVVTGRDNQYFWLTKDWLRFNEIHFDELHTRPRGDRRKDVEVKREILNQLRKFWTIIHAWDDNPAIIELWESEGIPVTVVPGWDE